MPFYHFSFSPEHEKKSNSGPPALSRLGAYFSTEVPITRVFSFRERIYSEIGCGEIEAITVTQTVRACNARQKTRQCCRLRFVLQASWGGEPEVIPCLPTNVTIRFMI